MSRIESFAPATLSRLPESVPPEIRAAAMLAHPRLAIAVTEGGRIRETNAAWQSLFALPAGMSGESQVAMLFANVQGASRFERALQAQLAAGDGAVCASTEHALVRRDGSAFVAEVIVWLFDVADAEHPMAADAIWQVRDVTAERALADELREIESYHRELSRHQWDLTFVIDRKGRVSYASPSVEEALGHPASALVGEPFTKLLAPGDAAAAGRWLRSASSRDRQDATDDGYRLHVLDRRGSERVLACRARNCFAVPRIAGMVVHGRDVGTPPDDPTPALVGPGVAVDIDLGTSVVTTPDAVSDPLTGLPDRAAARRWLDKRVADLAADASLTLLSIDLDRLRDINDRLGDAAGDEAIAASARALTAVIGSGGYLARVGGNAFVAVLGNAATKAVDDTVALILERIETCVVVDGPPLAASIGVACLPRDAEDAETLWLHADLAMREAKARGRGQAFVFNRRLADALRVRSALEVEIVDALARDEFVLFYQPQIALATGRIVGLEALLRWQHPTRGLLLPNVFLDTAVESGLIEAITKTVVGQVCEQIAAWRRAGAFPELPVGINVSGSQFHDRRLPALVAAALLRSGLPARLLILELSEQNLVADDPETERVVKELSRLGARTAVGGFALGHGALKQLRSLRVAQIKLDRDFVGDLATDESAALVVATMIDIARRLKCQVVAEGVETREQFEQLRTLGCEIGQGFWFGAPLSADEILAYVANNGAHPLQ